MVMLTEISEDVAKQLLVAFARLLESRLDKIETRLEKNMEAMVESIIDHKVAARATQDTGAIADIETRFVAVETTQAHFEERLQQLLQQTTTPTKQPTPEIDVVVGVGLQVVQQTPSMNQLGLRPPEPPPSPQTAHRAQPPFATLPGPPHPEPPWIPAPTHLPMPLKAMANPTHQQPPLNPTTLQQQGQSGSLFPANVVGIDNSIGLQSIMGLTSIIGPRSLFRPHRAFGPVASQGQLNHISPLVDYE